MRKLIVAEFVTLDGVIEAPGFEEHPDGKNAWALRYATEDNQRHNIDQMLGTDALLLGRKTYQIFAAFWPSADDDTFAPKMNSMPKYVVSRSLADATWNNTTILRDIREVSPLKQEPGGDILVVGSADLVDGLLEHGLVDELDLMVHPVILGSGKRLFREHRDLSHWELASTTTFDSGVVLLTYVPAAQGPSSEYTETYAWNQEAVKSMEAAQNADRVLASVLFTDIVDSTGRAATLGDKRWQQVLELHDRTARIEVERFHGTLVKTTGDGILATFDAPTRALRCAFEVQRSLADAGLGIRAAIHTGEIEIRSDDIGGIGVHIASRVLSQAGEGQVVVTRTVRELATGTDLAFSPLGTVGLRGVPDQWELFEASTR